MEPTTIEQNKPWKKIGFVLLIFIAINLCLSIFAEILFANNDIANLVVGTLLPAIVFLAYGFILSNKKDFLGLQTFFAILAVLQITKFFT